MEGYKISQNNKFIIDLDNPHVLYSSKILSSPLLRHKGTKLFFDVPYHKYSFLCGLYENDCLKFAEALVQNLPIYTDPKSIYIEKESGYVFGHTYVQNIKIARNKYSNNSAKNEKANPQVGEAYAIVRTKKSDEAPYHIAYVLYKDGETNITLEADAGDLELLDPIFDMYSTTTRGDHETFHDTHKESMEPASTIVLVKRNV